MTKKSFPILTTFLVCLVALTGFVGIKDSHKEAELNSSTHGAKTEVVRDQNRAKHLTKQKTINYYKAQAPNLTKVESSNSKKLKQAFTIASTKLHSNKAVKKYSPIIKKNIGTHAGNELIQSMRPTTTATGKTIQQSAKLVNFQYGYGKYQDGLRLLPVSALIEVRTSPYINGSGNTRGMESQTYYFYDSFQFYIHINNQNKSSLLLVSHTHSQNNEKE